MLRESGIFVWSDRYRIEEVRNAHPVVDRIANGLIDEWRYYRRYCRPGEGYDQHHLENKASCDDLFLGGNVMCFGARGWMALSPDKILEHFVEIPKGL